MDSRLNAIRLQLAISFQDLFVWSENPSSTTFLFGAVIFLNELRQCCKWATLPSSDWPLVNPALGLNEVRAISDHCGRSSPLSTHGQPAVSMPRVSIQTQVVPRLEPLPLTRRVCVCESEAERERDKQSYEIASGWHGSKWLLFQIAHFNLIG